MTTEQIENLTKQVVTLMRAADAGLDANQVVTLHMALMCILGRDT